MKGKLALNCQHYYSSDPEDQSQPPAEPVINGRFMMRSTLSENTFQFTKNLKLL